MIDSLRKIMFHKYIFLFLILYSVGHLRYHGMGTKSLLVKIIMETAMNLCGAVIKISSGEWEARVSISDRSRFFTLLC